MKDKQKELLRALLCCGNDDLSMLDDTEYDFFDVIQSIWNDDAIPTLNRIMEEIFIFGIIDLKDAIENKISEYEDELKWLDPQEAKALDIKNIINALKYLNPDEDVEYYCNCQDTSVSLYDPDDTYKQFLSKEISEIERKMGFEFKEWCR